MRWRDLRRVGEGVGGCVDAGDGAGGLVVGLGLGLDLGVTLAEVDVVSGGWLGEDVIFGLLSGVCQGSGCPCRIGCCFFVACGYSRLWRG